MDTAPASSTNVGAACATPTPNEGGSHDRNSRMVPRHRGRRARARRAAYAHRPMICQFPTNTPLTGYQYGCRCARCVDAMRGYNSAYQRKIKHKRPMSIGPLHGPRRPPKRTSAIDRVLARVMVNAAGCWMWQGAVSAKGYGAINVDGRVIGVHRVTFANAHGPVPNGLHVDHLCAVRLCCNPVHLEAVTPAENDRRARARLAI